tara:strand:+ start:610 stop:1083 length:474 start_codon:yes stop_codon:yes gene_type:complete
MPAYGRGYTGSEKVYSEETVQKLYSDISLIFKPSPSYTNNGLSGDVVRRYDNESVRQSVRNILMTNKYEKPFDRDFGCNLIKFNFDRAGAWSEYEMSQEIKRQMSINEPRIILEDVQIKRKPEKQIMDVLLLYKVKPIDSNTPSETVDVQIKVERIR